jgi:hypothetical protein
MAIDGGPDDLAHAIRPSLRDRAVGAAGAQLNMQGIDVVDIQIPEPLVAADLAARVSFGTVAQHPPHLVALGKAPVGGRLPEDAESGQARPLVRGGPRSHAAGTISPLPVRQIAGHPRFGQNTKLPGRRGLGSKR